MRTCLSIVSLIGFFFVSHIAPTDEFPLRGAFTLNQPVSVYNNWSAYDELSDNVELTEELALRQLREMVRLKQAGVVFDYYVMDAFWYDPDGGYRTFVKPNWPNGPDRWLALCKENNIKPGLWVATNYLSQMNCLPEWKDSLDDHGQSLCLFEGGYLPHFMETLQYWYDRGVRLYKFDFANFYASPVSIRQKMSNEEIFKRNTEALRDALFQFRERNRDIVLTAFNGFGGEMNTTDAPIRKTVDLRWLDVFDSLYCGDPRPADVPCMNFWRSKDIYTDHMVRYYELNGIPLERIDNTEFMVGTTGTCYKRGTAAWEGMLVLTLARGGWMNVFYGNMELIDQEKSEFFAKAQSLYFALQALGQTITFGGIPGQEEPYGYCSVGEQGSVYTVMNPKQAFATFSLLRLHRYQKSLEAGRILFTDAGNQPILKDTQITLGPEQMAVVGFGEYAKSQYDMGIEDDVVIPVEIKPLDVTFQKSEKNTIEASLTPPAGYGLRVILRQSQGESVKRTSGGSPPNGKPLGQILMIQAQQNEKEIPVRIQYDKAIWSGLSWGVGEIRSREIAADAPLTITLQSKEKEEVEVRGDVYAVKYEE